MLSGRDYNTYEEINKTRKPISKLATLSRLFSFTLVFSSPTISRSLITQIKEAWGTGFGIFYHARSASRFYHGRFYTHMRGRRVSVTIYTE